MTRAVLITECLQNDFVKPLGEGESLPNLLHVGAMESRRLMGEDPARGPVARAMEWAYAQAPEDLAVIHLRDPLQLLIGQLRYAVHTLGFDESPSRNKTWALYNSCRLAERIMTALGPDGGQ